MYPPPIPPFYPFIIARKPREAGLFLLDRAFATQKPARTTGLPSMALVPTGPSSNSALPCLTCTFDLLFLLPLPSIFLSSSHNNISNVPSTSSTPASQPFATGTRSPTPIISLIQTSLCAFRSPVPATPTRREPYR